MTSRGTSSPPISENPPAAAGSGRNLRRKFRVPLIGDHDLEVFALCDGSIWRAVRPWNIGPAGMRLEFPPGGDPAPALGSPLDLWVRRGTESDHVTGTVCRVNAPIYGVSFPELAEDRPLHRIIHTLQLRWLRTRVRS